MTPNQPNTMELPTGHSPCESHPADMRWWKSVDHCVHVIDDDSRFLDILSCVLEDFEFHVESYSSAERFLATLTTHAADCVLLDMRMPSMNGVDLLKALRAHHVNTPVLMLSAYSDIPGVVAAMQNGAADYLVKPTNEQELLTKVSAALQKNWSDKKRSLDKNQRLRSLSAREREVMDLLVDAKTTTQVAHTLGISPKTVEKHRLNIFDKLNVDSVPVLMRLLFDCQR